MSRGNRLRMARPRTGKMSTRLCEVMPCMESATHWVDDGAGYDGEYCEAHAKNIYETALAKYEGIDTPAPQQGAMSE
jgi:hypothetical protein